MKRLVVFFIVLIVGFQLVNLQITPLFADEALYCGLGQEFGTKPVAEAWDLTVNHWKVAPLLSVVQGLGFRLFSGLSPIVSCRSVSVLAGAFTAWLLWLIVKQLTDKPIIHYATLAFFLLNPFSFFTNRTSLQEPLLTLFLIVTTYFCLRAIKEKRWLFGICPPAGGLALGFFVFSFLSKLNGLIIVPGLLILLHTEQKTKKQLTRSWRLALELLGLALVLVYWSKRATPLWQTVGYHAWSLSSLSQLIERISANLHLIQAWYIQYLTPLFIAALVLGGLKLWHKKRFTWILVPLSILAIYAVSVTGFFPRYLLITLPFWAILVGFAAHRALGTVLVFVMLVVFVARDFTIITNPAQSPIAKEDHLQFFEDWTSGSGTKDALTFLETQVNGTTILLPSDLEYTFKLQQQTYLPHKTFALYSVKDSKTVHDELAVLDPQTTIILVTTHQAWVLQAASEKYVLEEVFASHQDQSRSALLYRFTPR